MYCSYTKNKKQLVDKDYLRLQISELSKSYIYSKFKLLSYEQNSAYYYESLNENEIASYRKIVDRFEGALSVLHERERLVIENEVIKGKDGKWYLEYFSASTYYRIRKDIYRHFLRLLG